MCLLQTHNFKLINGLESRGLLRGYTLFWLSPLDILLTVSHLQLYVN